MPWPAPDLPIDFQNATVSADTHPGAHNDTNLSLNNDYRPQIESNRQATVDAFNNFLQVDGTNKYTGAFLEGPSTFRVGAPDADIFFGVGTRALRVAGNDYLSWGAFLMNVADEVRLRTEDGSGFVSTNRVTGLRWAVDSGTFTYNEASATGYGANVPFSRAFENPPVVIVTAATANPGVGQITGLVQRTTQTYWGGRFSRDGAPYADADVNPCNFNWIAFGTQLPNAADI